MQGHGLEKPNHNCNTALASTPSDQQYKKQMHHIAEFNKHIDLRNKYGNNAYMLWALGLHLDEPDLDALAGRSLTDGGNDKCLDFIEIDKTGQKIVVAQGFFSEKNCRQSPCQKSL